jgi:hypothetical protein
LLEVVHPSTGELVKIESPLPADMRSLVGSAAACYNGGLQSPRA